MASMQSMFEVYVKSQKKTSKSKNVRNVTTTPVTVPTANRKLGTATQDLVILGSICLSHKPCPIKVVDTALNETTKADQIATKTAKNGMVTAVVAVMSIFSTKRCKKWSANLGNEKPSCQKQKEPIFQRKTPADQEAHLKNQEKARYRRN